MGNVPLFLLNFKQRIQDCYLQEWNDSLVNSTKLELFRSIKLNFEYAQYLSLLREKKLRSILFKFRISNHQLAIKTGRHHQNYIPREERICRFYLINNNINIVEDEYHFIIVCPLYQHYRNQYLTDILSHFNILNK